MNIDLLNLLNLFLLIIGVLSFIHCAVCTVKHFSTFVSCKSENFIAVRKATVYVRQLVSTDYICFQKYRVWRFYLFS